MSMLRQPPGSDQLAAASWLLVKLSTHLSMPGGTLLASGLTRVRRNAWRSGEMVSKPKSGRDGLCGSFLVIGSKYTTVKRPANETNGCQICPDACEWTRMRADKSPASSFGRIWPHA